MAGTLKLGSFDNGLVDFELSYNDALDAVIFRCNNRSESGAFGILKQVDEAGLETGIQFGMEATPGRFTTIAIPAGAKGFRVAPASKPGVFGGFVFQATYPF